MTTRITIELKDEAALMARLRKASESMEDLRPMLSQIGAVMEANVDRRFDTKVDPSGRPWQKLSRYSEIFYAMTSGGERKPGKDDWAALRRGDIAPAKLPGSLLERTRRMRESLTTNVGPDYVDIGMSRLSDGGRWSIPALHEFGTKSMPRRGLLTANPVTGTLGEQDRADVVEVVDDWLRRLL